MSSFGRRVPSVGPGPGHPTGGVVAVSEGTLLSVLAFTITDGRIVEIDALVDPERLARLDLAVLGG